MTTNDFEPSRKMIESSSGGPVLEGNIPFFSVYKYPRTYVNILYLLLTFPLGIAFFVYAVTGFSVSIGLIVTFVGIILLYGFLWSLPRLMYIQGIMVEFMLGIKMPERVYKPPVQGGVVSKAFASLKDKRIIKTLLYFLFPAMPFGIAVFTIAVTLLSVSLGFIAYPWAYLIETFLSPAGDWIQYVFAWSPAAGYILLVLIPIVGIFMLTATLHLTNKLAYAHGRMVKRILLR